MEILNYLNDKMNIDYIIVLIVFLSGYFQELYLCGLVFSKSNPRYDAAIKTLLVSFVVGSIYIYFMYRNDRTVPVPYVKYFISYFVATSLYDLAVKPVRNLIKKLVDKYTGGDNEGQQ